MKINSIEELGTLLNNSPDYKGKIPKYQTKGRKKYQTVINLNPYQTLLYKRALYGLKMYSAEEQNKMHWEKKKRIQRVSIKTQISINLLKQELVNQGCKTIFEEFFPNSELAKNVLSDTKITTDSRFINTLDLKSLGITKEIIIDRLIKAEILPKNFYKLKKAA